ncbi:unnamed protein product [Moneuplotes crassus]|uniref:Uncharacterized protein n=1 Tax=Euplotes crassus TaxID=5936 RepID=A0AAD1XNL7_EUPCR|nr:unnamed protein product [Moneuplotes crassus]
MIVSFCTAMYREGCPNGYYEAGGCKPCPESCKTCNDGNNCDQCIDSMMLKISANFAKNNTEDVQICDNCPEGEYYDKTSQICRSCESRCNDQCGYQKSCFQCAQGQVYDLEEGICINESSCIGEKHFLKNDLYTTGNVCRMLEYYIDPLSEANMELGTQKYPYRSFKTLSSEILNVHSHTNVSIVIYIVDAYVLDGELMFINMTSVELKSHPEYSATVIKNGLQESRDRALIIPTYHSQHGITSKARFHILKHSDWDINEIIERGDLTDYELNVFPSSSATFQFLRTSFHLEGVDFYREAIDEDLKYTLFSPIFLQDKWITIRNSDFNISGFITAVMYSMNFHAENLRIEGYRLRGLIVYQTCICNYPGAFVNPTVSVKNVTYMRTSEKIGQIGMPFIVPCASFNLTIEQIDLANYLIKITSLLFNSSSLFPKHNSSSVSYLTSR